MRRICGRGQADGAGVVDQGVDAAELLDGLAHHPRDVLFAADVDPNWQSVAARGLHFGGDRVDGARQLGVRLVRLGRNHQVGSFGRAPQRNGSPDAAAGACNHDGSAGERVHGVVEKNCG